MTHKKIARDISLAIAVLFSLAISFTTVEAFCMVSGYGFNSTGGDLGYQAFAYCENAAEYANLTKTAGLLYQFNFGGFGDSCNGYCGNVWLNATNSSIGLLGFADKGYPINQSVIGGDWTQTGVFQHIGNNITLNITLYPSFTVVTADASTAGSPTNNNTNVTFTGTATDPQGDNWFLLICNDTSGITGGNCVGTEICKGTTIASGAASSCQHNVSGEVWETNNWWSYACDASNYCSPLETTNSPYNVNHPPASGTPTITGGPYDSDDTINCTNGTLTDSDTNDNPQPMQYRWYKNGTYLAAWGSAFNLDCNTATGCNKTINVSCANNANDTHNYVGDFSTTSNQVVIQNSAPTITAVSISPASPLEIDNLNCSVTGWSDGDGDTENYYFEWYRNSTLNMTMYTSSTYHILSSSNTSDNEDWNCTVIPYDGTVNGTAGSDNVTIQADTQAPTIQWVDANPLVIVQNQTTNLTAQITDNNDIQIVLIQINGTNYSMTQNGIIWNYTHNATEAVGTYVFTVYANDSSGNSATMNGNFTVIITGQPGGAQVVITSPVDDSTQTNGTQFTTTANITAVSGNITGCNATISFSNENIINITAADNYTHSIGSLNSGESTTTSWTTSANSMGSSNITVTTVCISGTGDSDSNYNITIQPDTQAPTITWVNADPGVVIQNQSTNLSASITDNLNVNSAWVEINNTNYSMSQSGTTWYYNYATTSLPNTTYTFTVYANDTNGNNATSMSGNFTVILPGAPGGAQVVITSPADDASQSNGSAFTTTANITAVSGNITGCNATISFSNENIINITGAESYTHVLGDQAINESNITIWSISANSPGNSNISVSTICTSGTGDVDSVYNITVTSAAAAIAAPQNLTSDLAVNNQSVILNWSQVSGAEGYYIYYSDNLTWIMQLNSSNAPATGNITLLGASNISWIDNSANQSTQRFYALTSYSGSIKNFTVDRMGKFDINLVSGEGTFSIPLNETRPIGEYMTALAGAGQTIMTYSGGWLMTFWDGTGWDSGFGFPNLTLDNGYLTTGFTAARNITNINIVPTGNITTSIPSGEGTFGWNSVTTEGNLMGNALLNLTGEAGGPTIMTYSGGWLMTFWDGTAWDNSFGFSTFQAGSGYLTTGFTNPANMTYYMNEIS